VTFENEKLTIKATNFGISFEGTYSPNDENINGTFTQGMSQLPLLLKRDNAGENAASRPQEPKAPFPYRSEEVTFENPAGGVKLAGTLTLPENGEKFPVVILISGSGPQDRNETVFGHKPFWVISDYLTRKGIAVLRYDDRGTASSTGDFSKATTVDLASDASAAVEYLRTRTDIDKKKIGLCGHSEGGEIAPMIASTRKDIDFIVLLAGPGMPGRELLLLQQQLICKKQGFSDEKLLQVYKQNKGAFDIIVDGTDYESTTVKLKEYFLKLVGESPASEKPAGVSDEELAEKTTEQLAGMWLQYFIKYDPAPALRKVRCPVLALGGSNDLQVPAKENLTAIKSALDKGGNKNVTIREYPSLNHLFQECKTGLPTEYGAIEQTISPQVLDDISGWILRQVK
jgi:hypothetical protein